MKSKTACWVIFRLRSFATNPRVSYPLSAPSVLGLIRFLACRLSICSAASHSEQTGRRTHIKIHQKTISVLHQPMDTISKLGLFSKIFSHQSAQRVHLGLMRLTASAIYETIPLLFHPQPGRNHWWVVSPGKVSRQIKTASSLPILTGLLQV